MTPLPTAPARAFVDAEFRQWFSRLFFFSSRRRHTSWPRDWSSDVCSSDLYFGAEEGQGLWRSTDAGRSFEQVTSFPNRSEERRVGKECRARERRGRYKKKISWCDGHGDLSQTCRQGGE